MSKIDIDKELGELIYRFKRLKKAIEEESSLTPAQRAATAAAEVFAKKLKKHVSESDAQAQQLANLLRARGILGATAAPLQPTDEQLFGHLVADPHTVKQQEQNWGNLLNDWLSEASKPISSRFKTPEEEQAYWDSIKVSDRGGGDYGY